MLNSEQIGTPSGEQSPANNVNNAWETMAKEAIAEREAAEAIKAQEEANASENTKNMTREEMIDYYEKVLADEASAPEETPESPEPEPTPEPEPSPEPDSGDPGTPEVY